MTMSSNVKVHWDSILLFSDLHSVSCVARCSRMHRERALACMRQLKDLDMSKWCTRDMTPVAWTRLCESGALSSITSIRFSSAHPLLRRRVFAAIDEESMDMGGVDALGRLIHDNRATLGDVSMDDSVARCSQKMWRRIWLAAPWLRDRAASLYDSAIDESVSLLHPVAAPGAGGENDEVAYQMMDVDEGAENAEDADMENMSREKFRVSIERDSGSWSHLAELHPFLVPHAVASGDVLEAFTNALSTSAFGSGIRSICLESSQDQSNDDTDIDATELRQHIREQRLFSVVTSGACCATLVSLELGLYAISSTPMREHMYLPRLERLVLLMGASGIEHQVSFCCPRLLEVRVSTYVSDPYHMHDEYIDVPLDFFESLRTSPMLKSVDLTESTTVISHEAPCAQVLDRTRSYVEKLTSLPCAASLERIVLGCGVGFRSRLCNYVVDEPTGIDLDSDHETRPILVGLKLHEHQLPSLLELVQFFPRLNSYHLTWRVPDCKFMTSVAEVPNWFRDSYADSCELNLSDAFTRLSDASLLTLCRVRPSFLMQLTCIYLEAPTRVSDEAVARLMFECRNLVHLSLIQLAGVTDESLCLLNNLSDGTNTQEGDCGGVSVEDRSVVRPALETLRIKYVAMDPYEEGWLNWDGSFLPRCAQSFPNLRHLDLMLWEPNEIWILDELISALQSESTWVHLTHLAVCNSSSEKFQPDQVGVNARLDRLECVLSQRASRAGSSIRLGIVKWPINPIDNEDEDEDEVDEDNPNPLDHNRRSINPLCPIVPGVCTRQVYRENIDELIQIQ